jgi:putative hydrolase of the HAD superfamily
MYDKKYSVVVFDLGNVLLPFDYNIIIRKFEKIEPGLGEKFYQLYKDNYEIHRKFEKNELSEDEFLSVMLEWLDDKVTAEEFKEIYSNIFVLNNKLINLLPNLKINYKLVILSNTNSIHQKYGYQNCEFLKLFDKLILSHEVGAVKPEEKIYKAVEEYTGGKPEAHIFIDDIPEYVRGAKNLGWDAVQYLSFEKLLKDFKERKIM